MRQKAVELSITAKEITVSRNCGTSLEETDYQAKLTCMFEGLSSGLHSKGAESKDPVRNFRLYCNLIERLPRRRRCHGY
jgi:hypothetical protein